MFPWDKMKQVLIFASISIAISITWPMSNVGKRLGVCTLSVGGDAV